MHPTDEQLMDLALAAAAEAGRAGDVPIGAVLVHEGEVLAVAGNRREQDADPTAHAEILALRAGGRRLGSWRLTDCTLYVTLEPCPMCMGAAINARIGRLVFATRDPKAGAAVSCFQLGSDERLNHRVVISEGVRGAEASAALSRFFASLRAGERSVWAPAAPQGLIGPGAPGSEAAR
jgi:tRNA(adenine34) deaminase